MTKFASCSRFASRAPCSCGGRTVWTDNNAFVAAADGRGEPPCDPKVCRTVERADSATRGGRTIRLQKLLDSVRRAQARFDEETRDLVLRKCAEVRPGQNQYACIVGGMQRTMIESRSAPALKIGTDRYWTKLIESVLRCVGRGKSRIGFVRMEYGPPTVPRPSVDLLALGDRAGSWSAGIMPLMPDQPHHAESDPESLEGRRRR